MYTIDDLQNIYIRVETEPGKWGDVNLLEATDKQFDAWSYEKIGTFRIPPYWPSRDRLEICNNLQRLGHM